MNKLTILLLIIFALILLNIQLIRIVNNKPGELILPRGFYEIKKVDSKGYLWIEIVNGKAFYRGGEL